VRIRFTCGLCHARGSIEGVKGEVQLTRCPNTRGDGGCNATHIFGLQVSEEELLAEENG
jgi:hypothetical protein